MEIDLTWYIIDNICLIFMFIFIRKYYLQKHHQQQQIQIEKQQWIEFIHSLQKQKIRIIDAQDLDFEGK